MAEPDKSPSDPARNKSLIAVALVGVNILCLGALIGASLLLSAPSHPEATATPTPEHASASASPTAEAKATAEPTAEAKATAEPAKDAASAAPSASAAAAAPKGGGTRAVVKLGPGRQKGVVRFKPEPKARLVLMLPAGTAVEITDKTTLGKQVWYQVKTIDFKPATTGWMHGDVLKME
jgi:cytoskeletal protein RodZ